MELPRRPPGPPAIVIALLLVTHACGEVTKEEGVRPQQQTHILCYKCNSEYDPRCGDPFNPYTIGQVNCSVAGQLEHLKGETPKICRKNVQKVDGVVRVVRGCGYREDEREMSPLCVRRSGTHNVLVHYCACKGHLCNTSLVPRPMSALLALLPLISLIPL